MTRASGGVVKLCSTQKPDEKAAEDVEDGSSRRRGELTSSGWIVEMERRVEDKRDENRAKTRLMRRAQAQQSAMYV